MHTPITLLTLTPTHQSHYMYSYPHTTHRHVEVAAAPLSIVPPVGSALLESSERHCLELDLGTVSHRDTEKDHLGTPPENTEEGRGMKTVESIEVGMDIIIIHCKTSEL